MAAYHSRVGLFIFRWPKSKIVGIQKLVGFANAVLEFINRRQNDKAKHGLYFLCFRMFPPDRLGQHPDHRLAQPIVLRASDLIQQSGDAEAAGIRADRRNPRFGAAIGVVQLEHQLARARHIRREKTISGFNARQVKVRGYALSQRFRQSRVLQQSCRNNVFRLPPIRAKRGWKNCPALRQNPEQFAR